MDDLVRRLLAAWPGGRGDVARQDRIRLQGATGYRYIFHDGRGLPPPFHRGMLIGAEHSGAEAAATALHRIVTHTADLCDDLRRTTDRLHAIAAPARMTVLGCMPTSISAGRGEAFHLGVTARIGLMGHSGLPEVMVEEIGNGPCMRLGWRRITIAANAQRRRRSEAGMALSTDPVMAACLDRMTDGARRRLLGMLVRKPEASRDVVGWSSGANWNHAALAMEGIALDRDIETIRVKDGVAIGRVRLSETTTWNAGTLIAKGASYPDSVLSAMLGKPLDEIVEHTLIPRGIRVDRAWMDATGAMRIRATYDGVEIS